MEGNPLSDIRRLFPTGFALTIQPRESIHYSKIRVIAALTNNLTLTVEGAYHEIIPSL
jgi:hypothetical protein